MVSRLTAKERREAEGLGDMAEWLSLLQMTTSAVQFQSPEVPMDADGVRY
jgi:hypothetical protein